MSRPPDDWTLDSSGLGAADSSTDAVEAVRVLEAENEKLRETIRLLEDPAAAPADLVGPVPSGRVSSDMRECDEDQATARPGA